MDSQQSQAEQPESRPKLVFVYGQASGPSRRVEAFLAQVLQARHNQETFELVRICAEKQPRLLEQLGVSGVPTILVIDQRQIRARLERPRGRRAIADALEPWLM